MAGDAPADWIGGAEFAQLVGVCGLDNPHDLLRIDAGVGLADPLQGVVEGECVGVRRRLGDNDVRHLAGLAIVEAVDFDDNLLGRQQERGRGANGIGQINPAVGRHLGGLDDRDVDRTEEAVQHRLRQVRQMHVDERDAAIVDPLTQRHGRSVGARAANGIGFGQGIVEAVPGGCSGEDADLERLSGGVHLPGPAGEGPGNVLGRPSRREPAESHRGPMRDQFGGFLGRQGGKRAPACHCASFAALGSVFV